MKIKTFAVGFLVGLLVSTASFGADLFVLRTGVGSQNGSSLANACHGPSDSDCSTNAAANSVVYLCDSGTGLVNSASSWTNANANSNVRWTGDCSAFGYQSRARITNTAGAYNLNFTGAGSATFEHIDFAGGGTSDCVHAAATGSIVMNDITIANCTEDGFDIDSLTGGLTFTNLTISDAHWNGFFCNSSVVRGTIFRGYRNGTQGSLTDNHDTIGIDDGCGSGSRITDIEIEDCYTDLGSCIDLQDSTGTGRSEIFQFHVKNAEGSGITATANAGTATQVFAGGIIENAKFSVYLKDTGGKHIVSGITTVGATSTELKIGDSGTSGDAIAAAEIQNNIFGGAACASGDAVVYWRNNASVNITMNKNNYCPAGVFNLASGGDTDFAGWKTASSQDAGSFQVVPPFRGGTRPSTLAGFRLTKTSLLIRQGLCNLTVGCTYNDATGRRPLIPPDIGGIQRGEQ